MYNVYTESPYNQDSTKCSLLLLNILFHWIYLIVVGQLLSRARLFATSWTAAHRFPYPSLSPGVYSNSCLLSWCCYLTILSSANSFSACPQSFPASGSFPMSWFFAWGGQSIRASASVLPMNIQDWFPLGLAGFFLLGVQGTLKSLLQHYNSKASILLYSAFFMVQLSDLDTTIGKTTAFTMWTFAGKVMSLLFSMLSRLVITFLPRSKHLLISWLHLQFFQ